MTWKLAIKWIIYAALLLAMQLLCAYVVTDFFCVRAPSVLMPLGYLLFVASQPASYFVVSFFSGKLTSREKKM